METRFRGASGLKVSALGFGVGTFGGKGPLFSAWGDTGVADASHVTPPYPYYPYWNGMFAERNPPPVPTPREDTP